MSSMSEEEISRVSEFFKVFGDPTRVRVLECLIERPRTVHEIVDCVNVSQSAVSHQLSILRKSFIVKTERDGRFITYKLDDEHIKGIFISGIEHIREGRL